VSGGTEASGGLLWRETNAAGGNKEEEKHDRKSSFTTQGIRSLNCLL